MSSCEKTYEKTYKKTDDPEWRAERARKGGLARVASNPEEFKRTTSRGRLKGSVRAVVNRVDELDEGDKILLLAALAATTA